MTSVSAQMRTLIYQRDGGVCQICLDPVEFDHQMHIDHISRVEDGGCDHPENLRATHGKCNWARKDRGPEVSHCPPLVRELTSRKRSVNLDADIWAWLDEEATRQCCSVNAVLRQAARALMSAKQQAKEWAGAPR